MAASIEFGSMQRVVEVVMKRFPPTSSLIFDSRPPTMAAISACEGGGKGGGEPGVFGGEADFIIAEEACCFANSSSSFLIRAKRSVRASGSDWSIPQTNQVQKQRNPVFARILSNRLLQYIPTSLLIENTQIDFKIT